MYSFNLSVLFLSATMPIWVGILLAVIGLALGGVGFIVYKKNAEKKVGSVKARVLKIEEDARAEAERIKAQGR